MNIEEFAALKVGDQVRNYSNGDGGGVGTVIETTSSGVRVVWGTRHERERSYEYPAAGTLWFHWTKVDSPNPGPGFEEPAG